MISYTKVKSWQDTKIGYVLATLSFAGSYTTGGDTLDLTADTTFKTGAAPLDGSTILNPNTLGTYEYYFIPGTSLKNGKLKIVNYATGLELAVGPYPASILANKPLLQFTIKKFVDLG